MTSGTVGTGDRSPRRGVVGRLRRRPPLSFALLCGAHDGRADRMVRGGAVKGLTPWNLRGVRCPHGVLRYFGDHAEPVPVCAEDIQPPRPSWGAGRVWKRYGTETS